jgi:hypothetical protein
LEIYLSDLNSLLPVLYHRIDKEFDDSALVDFDSFVKLIPVEIDVSRLIEGKGIFYREVPLPNNFP